MDKIIHSKLGKLRTICSLSLFSDSICLKTQSAAEHGFTQTVLSIVLAGVLNLSEKETCALIELSIFSELPKVLLGDPSFYLRERHSDVKRIYDTARGRLWKEVEESFNIQTSRNKHIYGVQDIVDAFAASLFIEREVTLGNQFFKFEYENSNYKKKCEQISQNQFPKKEHPVIFTFGDKKNSNVDADFSTHWQNMILFLDSLRVESREALENGGIGAYSATFLGMLEKLKEHYRYKGWSYHFAESVAEHTYQVLFLCWLIAHKFNLPQKKRNELYLAAAFHDLAEAYASDVVYPVKMREKDMVMIHTKLEKEVIENLCKRFQLTHTKDPFILMIVEICDRFSTEIYFDRERRSGNSHFNLENISMQKVRDMYFKEHPDIFNFIDELWLEYTATLA